MTKIFDFWYNWCTKMSLFCHNNSARFLFFVAMFNVTLFYFELFSFSRFWTGGECGCGCVDSSNTIAISSGGPNIGPSNSNKTAHTKVATSGGHANTQAPSKRASSGADGDYQLVQHEVLYSLSAEYEVCSFTHFFFHFIHLRFDFPAQWLFVCAALIRIKNHDGFS